MRTLAPKYGLSDVGLAKICKKHRIPRPGLGYCAKKDAGKPVKQPPLRPFPGMEEITIRMTEVREQPKLPVDDAKPRRRSPTRTAPRTKSSCQMHWSSPIA
jgi:hypothetical protein